MNAQPVPVVVLAGFLGAGKTTVLNHLLRSGGGGDGGAGGRARLGVLVNDFGAINIDALLVAGQADGAVTLSNGCMCCSVDRDGLDEALVALARPEAGLDAIVIEASGIAEPKALVRLVAGLDDPAMRYGGLVYVVDAAGFGALRERHPDVDAHLAIADLVVVNKRDLVEEHELAHLLAAVRAVNPSAPTVAVAEGRIDPGLLFDRLERDVGDDSAPRQLTLDELLIADTDSGCDDHGSHVHLHDAYQSVEVETSDGVDPRRLAALLHEPPVGCYRIKGVVRFDLSGYPERYVVHAVGGFVRVVREGWSAEVPHTAIVAIGSEMDPVAARQALENVLATAETPDDKYGILHITRYLHEPS
ncbi:CobW family GTP-binding protein [Gordonia aichiensis]